MGSLLDQFKTVTARLAWLMHKAGSTYGGKRDMYKIFGYNPQPSHEDFVAKYLRQDVAQRVILAPVDAIWVDPPKVTGSGQFNSIWEGLEKLRVFHALRQVDIFAGLGKYAVLFIGLDDGANPLRPVNTNRVNKVIYFQPFLQSSVSVKKCDDNPTSPRYGLPEIYQISPSMTDAVMGGSVNSVGGVSVMRTIEVHHSRVLHVCDGSLESPIYGHSRLEPIYNRLDDLEKVVGGAAETFWLTGNRGVHADVDKEMELTAEDANNLSEEIEEYQHQLRRFIRTRGVKIASLGSDVADPTGPFTSIINLISAATGIPQRILMGAEAGQLASQQDRANWAQRVDERIRIYILPRLFNPFIDKLVAMNVLPAAPTDVIWPDTFKLNPFERAQTSAQMARSFVNIARGLQTTQEMDMQLVSIEEARSMISFGGHMPVFEGLPKGTKIPDLPEPVEAVGEGQGAAGVTESDARKKEEESNDNRKENAKEG